MVQASPGPVNRTNG